jgi:hypothetical protein
MRRSTAIALILLVLLGGLYWYTNQEDNLLSASLAGTPTPALTMPEYLVEPFTKTVTSLEIRLTAGEQLTLDFSSGIWTAQDANGDLGSVDQSAATSAVMAIQDLRILSEIEPETGLGDFGLQPAATAEIEVVFSDVTTLSLRVGKATPTGSGYYALDSSQPNRVLVLPKLEMERLLTLPLDPPIAITNFDPEELETP